MSKAEIVPQTRLSTHLNEKQSLLDQTNFLVLHSGNVLYELLQTSEELSGNTLNITNLDDAGDMSKNRDELKITVKLFLEGYYAEVIDDAVMNVVNDLQCKRLDTVMLSFPPTSTCPKQTFRSIRYNDIESIWNKLQILVKNGIIENLGVCDFDAASLKDLYECSQVKPAINQINLAHCCTPPDELTACAKSYNIELLTHNDPREILPPILLKSILPEKNDNSLWKAVYLMKYSSMLKFRGVIKSKGYILCMKKEDGK